MLMGLHRYSTDTKLWHI